MNRAHKGNAMYTLTYLNWRAAILLALLALASATFDAVQGHAQEPAPAAVVEVAPAVTAKLAPTRWVPGSVVSRDDAKIASAEAGRLEFVAEVGTRLKAGERLAKLDDQALRLRREEIQADVRRAEAQRALSDTQLKRLEKLESSSTIAKSQIDEARATLETNAQSLAHSRAQLRQIEHDIELANVRAPFSGVVTERFAQRGEYLQIGAMIAHLVDTNHIEARVQAPLALAGKVRAGIERHHPRARRTNSPPTSAPSCPSATNARASSNCASRCPAISRWSAAPSMSRCRKIPATQRSPSRAMPSCSARIKPT